jgi:hypothetical protein
MKFNIFILFIVIILAGQIHNHWAYADTIYTDARPGSLGYTLETMTSKGDKITMKYQATLNSEKKIERSFKITIITRDEKMSLMEGAHLEISETFKNFFNDRDAEASFMIELLYLVRNKFYSRREVLQGVTRPAGLTKIQVLKYPVYSNVGNRISDINSGVLINADSVCHLTTPNITVLQILNGDFDQINFRCTECVDVNPQAIVLGAKGEILTLKGKIKGTLLTY